MNATWSVRTNSCGRIALKRLRRCLYLYRRSALPLMVNTAQNRRKLGNEGKQTDQRANRKVSAEKVSRIGQTRPEDLRSVFDWGYEAGSSSVTVSQSGV